MADTFYYNLSINTATGQTSGTLYGNDNVPQIASADINNSIAILDNPDDWYCSIIRFEYSGYTLPLISFLVQTPVTDINKGIYSFTLSYGATDSAQTFYTFVPQLQEPTIPIPPTGTSTQTFSPYYFLYDYTALVDIMNVALLDAFNDLKASVGLPIAGAVAPFFYYNCVTEKIELYTDKTYFDKNLVTPIKIYFNSPSYVFLEGFTYTSVHDTDLNGKDALITIDSANGINDINYFGQITPPVPLATTYIKSQQQYVSLGYMSLLKSIIITTNMNIYPEAYNLSKSNLGTNVSYQNIMFDFLPDLAQPSAGISGYKFIYNAPNLYRIFSFKQKSPLMNISASVSWVDNLGNVYPLVNEKGQTTEIKFMFIKKSLYKNFINKDISKFLH